MDVLAVIPVRSGSKSVKDKNIRPINEKPMLAYSIEHAKSSRYVNWIIVSTDSALYAEIVRQYGAKAPFLRPAQFATDSSLDIEVFCHALNYLSKHEGYVPNIVVQPRPTYPIRSPADIDNMVEMLRGIRVKVKRNSVTASINILKKSMRSLLYFIGNTIWTLSTSQSLWLLIRYP